MSIFLHVPFLVKTKIKIVKAYFDSCHHRIHARPLKSEETTKVCRFVKKELKKGGNDKCLSFRQIIAKKVLASVPGLRLFSRFFGNFLSRRSISAVCGRCLSYHAFFIPISLNFADENSLNNDYNFLLSIKRL